MAEPLTLTKIHFIAGARPDATPLSIEGSRVIVLVGPNNAGKSMALRELEGWASGTDSERLVIKDAEVHWPNLEESLNLMSPFEATSPNPMPADHLFLSAPRPGKEPAQIQLNPEALQQWLTQGNDGPLRSQLLQLNTLRLDGRGRFALADPQESGDLQKTPRNHLWRLLQDDASRKKARSLVKEAFGFYFFIDATGMKEFRIRLAASPPPVGVSELSFDPAARDFAAEAPLLTELGDGVQAFVGLISAVLGLPSRLLLIDEPEAFLHPVLSRRLGSNLVDLANDRAGTLVVATHSANFLMGCIEQAAGTTVVRLTYDSDEPTARVLPSEQLSELMQNPLLRSTGALNGLFHRAVVITEADNDRAFYGEINRRLVGQDRGVPDCLFLNAQNWQTTARIMGPLRAVGIPAVVIIDLDALASSESWSSFFVGMGLDNPTRAALGQQKAACAKHLRSVGKRAYKKEGLQALGATEKPEVEAFLELLRRYGVFVVPVGEVEGWLAGLGVTGSKTTWAVRMLERLGNEPSSPGWVEPQPGDVWDFLDLIAKWVDDPERMGIPI